VVKAVGLACLAPTQGNEKAVWWHTVPGSVMPCHIKLGVFWWSAGCMCELSYGSLKISKVSMALLLSRWVGGHVSEGDFISSGHQLAKIVHVLVVGLNLSANLARAWCHACNMEYSVVCTKAPIACSGRISKWYHVYSVPNCRLVTRWPNGQ
jgi:hypothetical protein